MFSVVFMSVQCDHYSWRNRLVPSSLPGATGIGSPWLQSSRHQTCLPRTSDIKDFPGHQTCAPPSRGPVLPDPAPCYWHLMAITRYLFKIVHLRAPPVVLTSGSHWSTYSWQAGGTHPTGMLSCTMFFCCLQIEIFPYSLQHRFEL